MAAAIGYTGEDRRAVSVQKEVGIALRKWALGIIAVGIFQFAAFIWGAATLHTTVQIHDVAYKEAVIERKELSKSSITQKQRLDGLDSSMRRLGDAIDSMTQSINKMSVDVAVLRRSDLN